MSGGSNRQAVFACRFRKVKFNKESNSMHVHLTRLNDAVHFRAVTPHSTVDMDGSAKVGGEGKGPLPTELVIAALGGCTGIDVVDILRKQN
jgi:putative redox protein